MPHASYGRHLALAFLLPVAMLAPLLHASPPQTTHSNWLTREYDFAKSVDEWHLDRTPRKVPDAPGFTELSRADAQTANKLDKNGVKVGKYSGNELSNREVVKFLVCRGVINANIHVEATVYLMEEGRDDKGFWCRLVSVDSYWTNRMNIATYDFAIRIDRDGSLWMMHPDHVGNGGLQPKGGTAKDLPPK